MASRLELHSEFIDIMGTRTEKESRVYFKPPASKDMEYPCIRYSRLPPANTRANNKIYNSVPQYEVIVIDPNPDSEIPSEILKRFPMCVFDREYTADNLTHTVLKVYY